METAQVRAKLPAAPTEQHSARGTSPKRAGLPPLTYPPKNRLLALQTNCVDNLWIFLLAAPTLRTNFRL